MSYRTIAKLVIAVAFVCIGATEALAEGYYQGSYGGGYSSGWSNGGYHNFSESGYNNSWSRDQGSYYRPYCVPGGGGAESGGWDRGSSRSESWGRSGGSGYGNYGGSYYTPSYCPPTYNSYCPPTYYQPRCW